jgi:hypothetical protein
MKYIITERKPAYFVWTYKVEAEDEDQAYMAVFNGVVEPIDYQVEAIDNEEIEYDIEEEVAF